MDNHLNPQDPENMLGYIDALADDLEKAWALGSELPLPDFAGIERVVIAGMGGSAIGGDLLSAYLAPTCPVPIISPRLWFACLGGWRRDAGGLFLAFRQY
ncbi:MAG TPA: hypothetical protein PLH68_04325 [Anaerolineaceae bacterium]|nr:hypothetical protein [Anaerolineaceae bacterium]